MRYRDNLPLVSANLLRMIYMAGSAIVLQLYLESLGATPFQVSLIEVVFWTGMLLFSPLWGAMSDVSGRRKLFLTLSILLAGIAIPVYALMGTVNSVLGVRFVFAVIAVAFPPAALAAMSASAETRERGRSLATYNTSRAIGFFLGWGGAGIVLELLGFQYTFYLFGVIGVLGFIAAILITDIDSPNPVSVREVWTNAKQRWIPKRDDDVFSRHGLKYLYAGLFLRKAGFIGIMSLIAVYAVSELGLTESMLGILLAFNPLSQLVFIDLFGSLADRYGRKKIFLTGFLASIPFPFMLLYGSNPIMFGGAYVLLGFSFAALVEGSTAFIGDIAPHDRQGEFMGFRKSSQGLAGVVGPLLAGWLATAYSFQAMLLVMGGLITAAFLVTWKGTRESMDQPDIRDSMAKDIAARVHKWGRSSRTGT